MKIINVTQENVERLGFFCYMSKKKSIGYQRKLAWLEKRFVEGMKIRMLQPPERGFIEYVPGEYAWRTVDAKGYMFIHCLWVVGRSKGKGYATALLNECIRDAAAAKLKGVATVTSENNWLVSRHLLEKHGFERVDEVKPSFSLMVKRFGKARLPSFVDNWSHVRRRFSKGLTVFRSDQCPYIEDGTNKAVDVARKAGIRSRVVDLEDASQVRQLSPSPYGVFSIVLHGELISYHYLLERDLAPLLH
ncbi:MAG: GNAT family N-acetyltransferase [Gemmatimonadota bacterium]|nr:MAG: GNAT family N-acetyltransferase [Gemmatimonadota bacterium]